MTEAMLTLLRYKSVAKREQALLRIDALAWSTDRKEQVQEWYARNPHPFAPDDPDELYRTLYAEWEKGVPSLAVPELAVKDQNAWRKIAKRVGRDLGRPAHCSIHHAGHQDTTRDCVDLVMYDHTKPEPKTTVRRSRSVLDS
jgi:hypothetical protein